jgi:hypothetical protein
MENKLNFLKTERILLKNVWAYMFGLIIIMIMISSTIFPKKEYIILLASLMIVLSIIIFVWAFEKIIDILLYKRNINFKEYLHNNLEIIVITFLLYVFHLFFYIIIGFTLKTYPDGLVLTDPYLITTTLMDIYPHVIRFSVIIMMFEYIYNSFLKKKPEEVING